MPMNSFGIPGFFYDPEKNKYFKIMCDHKYGPNHPYSQYSISNRKKSERDTTVIFLSRGRDMLTLEQAENVNFRQKPMNRSYLECRSISHQPQSIHKKFRSRLSLRNYQFTFGYADPYANVTAMAYDSNTDSLIFGDQTGLLSLLPTSNLIQRPLFNFFSETTCVAVGPDSRIVATSLGNERGAGMIHISTLSNQEESFDLQNHITLTPHRNKSIWTCAVSPSNKIAVGGSGMFMLIEQSGHDCTQRILKSKSDVFAVEFLNENLCIAGSRDGCLRAFDSRLKSEENSLLFRHSSTVTGIKVLSEYEIVVGGLRSSLQLRLYDLRFPHPPAPSSMYSAPSKPVFEYTGHVNEHDVTLGFDVNRNTGIIAAVGSDNRLRFWNAEYTEPFNGPKSLCSLHGSFRSICLNDDEFWISLSGGECGMEQYKIS